MHSFILLAMISVQWVLWGYSIAFGPDIGGIIGSFQYVGLATVGASLARMLTLFRIWRT